jgi:hypothetical protein
MMHRNCLPLKAIAIVAIFIQGCSGGGDAEQAAAPEAGAAGVFIISPADGETVRSPVTVKFGIENFAIAPAGTFESGSGHHHLLVDTEVPPLDRPIPTDANHLHFGKGQTETELELTPGQHTLQLLLGDGAHIPHTEPLMSERITITVE